jgi:hypothetical protein
MKYFEFSHPQFCRVPRYLTYQMKCSGLKIGVPKLYLDHSV